MERSTMKNILNFCFIVFSPLLGSCESASDFSAIHMDVEVRIIDENGSDLTGVKIDAAFRHTPLQRKRTGNYVKKFTKTNSDETSVGFSYFASSTVSVSAEKEGYWRSGIRHWFTNQDRIDKDDGSPNGHYKKKFEIILQKKDNPRPLFVQGVNAKIPGFGQPLGFDLEKSDWVPPYGKGVYSDFIFTIEREIGEHPIFRGDMLLEFSNQGDGYIKVQKPDVPYSALHLGQSAPLDGYKARLKQILGVGLIDGGTKSISSPTFQELKEIQGYWFRVRSRETKNGVPKEARYGKILGNFDFDVRGEKPSVNFTYYFTPDSYPGLEWNGENLLRGANLQSVKKF